MEDFTNKLRILFGGQENWTDDNSQRTYKAANDTNVYNTDMNSYPYPEAIRSGMNPVTGSQYTLDETGSAPKVTDTFTYNEEVENIDSSGNIDNGRKTVAKEQEDRNRAKRNDDFISVLRGLFGLFDSKK